MSGSNVATSHLRQLTIRHGIIKSDHFSLLRISATRVIVFCNSRTVFVFIDICTALQFQNITFQL